MSAPVVPSELPVLPVSNVIVFPYMAVPLIVGRASSIAAVEAAASTNRLIAVFLQKDENREAPAPADLHSVGAAVLILKMGRVSAEESGTPTGLIHLLVQGVSRVQAAAWLPAELNESPAESSSPHLRARVQAIDTAYQRTPELDARAHSLQSAFRRLIELAPNIPDEVKFVANEIDDYGKLADYVASILNLEPKDRQLVLETFEVAARVQRVNELAAAQIAVLELSGKIQDETRKELDKAQRDYYLRQQLKEIHEELGEGDERAVEINELREKIEAAGMPEEPRKAADRELDRLARMPPQAAEYTVSRTYLDWLITLPWSASTDDSVDLGRAQAILDEDHFDLKEVKERILEVLAVRKLKAAAKGPILCFVGPPGVGKTSLGHSIARAMGRKFARISLGGVRDEAEIRGHRRTYIGSLPGRLIQGMKSAGANNPVFMLDEIDKLGADFRGDPGAALLEVLDPQQNKAFSDHYLDVPFDLSRVFFITTANILDPIPSALLDRMEVLRLSGYTLDEKVAIAEKYLIPRQLDEQGLTRQHLTFTTKSLRKIVQDYTREAGLRNLERELGRICRKVAREVAEAGKPRPKTRIVPGNVPNFLGPRRFEPQLTAVRDRIGVATGLAWTSAGGEILFVEAARMKGNKGLRLTGQLGEVMQESAHTALSYLRAHAHELGLALDFFEVNDLHIHVPAGATPKDGPSAGVAMTVALASLLLNRPARKEVAMTGEISLTGRVLPIGGVKEKVLAAHQAGIKHVILPENNRKDLEEVPEEIRSRLQWTFVRNIDDALAVALSSYGSVGPNGRGRAQR